MLKYRILVIPLQLIIAVLLCPAFCQTEGNIEGKSHTSFKMKEEIKVSSTNSNYTIISCGAALLHNGLIYIHGENDIYQVETVAGSGDMTGSLIKSSYFFGPLHITNQTCRQTLETNPICYDHSSDSGLFSVPCRTNISKLTVIMILMALLVTIIEVSIFRYFYITKWFTIKGFVLKEIIDKNGCWYYKMVSADCQRVLYSSDRSDRDSLESTTPLTGDFKTFKIEKKKIILFFLLLSRPVDVMASPLFTPNSQSVINSEFILQEGDTLSIGNFSLLVETARRTHPLTFLYDTYNYSIYSEKDWHCSDNACNSHGPCGKGGSVGVPLGSRAWNMQKDNKLHFYQRFCNWGSSGCFMHQGCHKWFIDVQMRPEDRASIYDIGQAIQDSRVVTNGANDCKLISVSDKTPTFVSKWSFAKRGTEDYICPYQDNHRSPVKGTLGDIQLSEKNDIVMDQSMFSCISSIGEGPSCAITESSLNSVLDRCVKLPGLLGSSKFSLENGYLVEETGESVSVTLSCDSKSLKTVSNDSCGGVLLSLYGREKSTSGVILTIKPKVMDNHGIWHGSVPCSDKLVTMPCSSQGLHIRVSWPSKCLDSIKIDSKQIIPESVMADYSQLQLGSVKVSDMETGLLGNLRNTLKFGWHLSPLPLPIIVIGVVVLLRR